MFCNEKASESNAGHRPTRELKVAASAYDLDWAYMLGTFIENQAGGKRYGIQRTLCDPRGSGRLSH